MTVSPLTFSYVVERIPSAGLEVDVDASPEWIGFLLGKFLRPGNGPFPLRYTLSRNDTSVAVDGELSLDFRFDCSRCAEEASDQVRVPFHLLFAHGRDDADENEEISIDVWGLDEDRELVVYEGPEVQLEDANIEQVVFALPAYPVCRPDCKGLCAECATNLNVSSCRCTEERVDPRWAKLKDLKV